MISFFCALVMVGQVVDGPTVTVDEFAKMMYTLHQPLEDVQFMYEGDFKFVGPVRLRGKQNQFTLDRIFQGLYAYRSDGATLLDTYDHPIMDNAVTRREVSAMLQWKVELMGQYADRKNAIGKTVKYPGQPGSFCTDGTPERFLYSWYFIFWSKRLMAEPKAVNYEFQGWELVDGHKCLRVQLDFIIHTTGGPFYRFWIDVERGGHPLKSEMWMGQTLEARFDKIALASFKLPDGKRTIWLPVSGVEDDFLWDKEHFSYPIFRAQYAIINGSVLFNQKLTDNIFTLKSPLLTRSLSLSGRQTFDSTPLLRTDAAGVQLRIETALKAADKQSKQLEASNPSEQQNVLYGWIQISLVVVGIVLLSVVLFQRRYLKR